MNTRRMQALAAVLTVAVQLPIAFYLGYRGLQIIGATELMWFLFWCYVPASFLSAVLFRISGYKPCD